MINRCKIHRIVEYIKLFDFEFDTYEVIENLKGVLAYYSIVDIELTDYEEYILVNELYRLAEQYEFREAAHMASQEDPLISCIRERYFSLKMQAIERKLTRAKSHTSVIEFLHNLALA